MIANCISCLSLFVSIVALYYSHLLPKLSKKKDISITVAENEVSKDRFKITVVYYNKGYKPMVIVNSHILLNDKHNLNAFTKENMFASQKGMKPIMLEGKKHCALELEYLLSDLDKITQDIDIRIHTSFICFEGIYYYDNSSVGFIGKNDVSPIIITICHERIKLVKEQSHFTMQGYIGKLNL